MTTRMLIFSLTALSVAITCFALDYAETDKYGIVSYDQPIHSFRDAYKTIKSQHRFDLHPKKPLSKEEYPLDNDIVPDLQVGCGDGLLVETTTAKPVIPKHKKTYPKKERRKRDTKARKPRSYFAYSVRTPSSVSYTIFRPHIYRLQRPYYIPIFGTGGRAPIYFPPQPVFVNPGYPYDNPNKGYLPPSTPPLPSTEMTPTTETTTLVPVGERQGPIWGPVDSSIGTTPTTTTSTFPPLVHNPDPNMEVRPPSTPRTTIARPRTTTARPRTTTTTTPPPPPRAQPPQTESNRVSQPGPNQCIWAIINCCSAGSKDISESCFERLGCPGPFWGTSPCESAIAGDAIDFALNYYQAK